MLEKYVGFCYDVKQEHGTVLSEQMVFTISQFLGHWRWSNAACNPLQMKRDGRKKKWTLGIWS